MFIGHLYFFFVCLFISFINFPICSSIFSSLITEVVSIIRIEICFLLYIANTFFAACIFSRLDCLEKFYIYRKVEKTVPI